MFYVWLYRILMLIKYAMFFFYTLLDTVTHSCCSRVLWLFLAGLELVCAFMVETGLDTATQTHTVLPDTQAPPGTPPPDFPSVG